MREIVADKRKGWILLGAFFLCFTIIARWFPFGNDDWAWGSDAGLQRLAEFFQGYNGRYLGNLSILAMTRMGPFLPVLMSLTICLIAFMIRKITGATWFFGIAFALLALMLLPINVFRETIVWPSGFSNYVLPIAILCFLVLLAVSLVRNPESEVSWGYVAIMAPVSFCGTLFVENVTLYLVALMLFLLVFVFFTNRRLLLKIGVLALVVFAGTAVMFSNSAYATASSSKNWYQEVDSTPDSIIEGSLMKFLDIVAPLVSRYWIVIVPISLGLAFLVLRRRRNWLAVLVACGLCGGTGYFAILQSSPWRVGETYSTVRVVDGVVFLLWYAFVVWAVVMSRGSSAEWKTMLFYAVSTLVIVAPLAVANPVSARLMLAPGYFLILLALQVICACVAEFPATNFAWGGLGIAMAAMLGASLLFYGTVYKEIDRVNDRREQIVAAAKKSGAKVVKVPQLPFSKYLYDSDPRNEFLQDRFKEYYGLAPDVKVVLIREPAAALSLGRENGDAT